MCNTESPVSAKNEQGIQVEALNSFKNLIGNINHHFLAITDDFACIRIAAIRRAKDRTPACKNVAYVLDAQGDNPFFIDEAIIPIPNPEDFTSVFINCSLNDCANDRIQPGCIAATGENTDSFHFYLRLISIILQSDNPACTPSYNPI